MNGAQQASEVALIETRGLSLHAEDRCLVAALDWRCMPGERWCLMGRNAVGKTTLLRALAGLPVPRREGTVMWDGREQRKVGAGEAAGLRAFAHQQQQDRFSISVGDLLELSVCVPGIRQMGTLVDRLDVAHLLARDVMRLSGGERQRVALAQCAMQGARLMLLDEPVAFQDPAHQSQVAGWLTDSTLDGSALVLSAHDVNWIARVATHVLALTGDGRWQAGTARSILTPDNLERVYGCAWTKVGDAFLVAP